MANTRIFDEVDGLKFVGVTTPDDDIIVGGVTSIGTEQGYDEESDGVSNGIAGPDDVSQAGQKVTIDLATTDVLTAIDLLNNDLASAEWFGHEATTAKYGKASLVKPVFTSVRLSAADGFASISAQGECVFPDAAATFDDVEGFLGGQNAPTLKHPSRLWQVSNAVYGALSAEHVKGLSLNIPGVALRDRNGTDIGMTSIVLARYGVVEVELTIRDSTPAGTPKHDLATQMMLAAMNDLTVDFAGVAETPDKTLNMRNVKFTRRRAARGRDWTGHTLSGKLQWRDPLTAFTARTLNHTTDAERLIYWT